jgi:hypothetical protein
MNDSVGMATGNWAMMTAMMAVGAGLGRPSISTRRMRRRRDIETAVPGDGISLLLCLIRWRVVRSGGRSGIR